MKRKYRFFAGFLTAQERWLNRMAQQGFRLVRTAKLLYEFEECRPGQVCYRMEFIGRKSGQNASRYRAFLEDMGYRTFYKNINLNYSVGKVTLRPWAQQGGRIATNATTYNRELLIVEKENDGTPFELHTTYEDRMQYCRDLRAPWLFLFAMTAVFSLTMRTWQWGVFAAFFLIPTALYQIELIRLGKEAKTKEW
mgnify:CR=1 FL=1